MEAHVVRLHGLFLRTYKFRACKYYVRVATFRVRHFGGSLRKFKLRLDFLCIVIVNIDFVAKV